MREMECDSDPTSLTWSLDGRAVGLIRGAGEAGQVDVITYDVASGRRLFAGPLYSDGPHPSVYLWAYKESFLVITMEKKNLEDRDAVAGFNIFEVQHVLVNIHPLSLTTNSYREISFSPTTCRIALSDRDVLRIFENWNSTCILEEKGEFRNHRFSSDGHLFAASGWFNVHIWEYGSSHFSPWKQFPFMVEPYSIQFSPNLSSIMQLSPSVLNVWRLHDLPPFPITNCSPQVGLTRSGQIIQDSGNFIAIFDPHSRPSQVHVVDAGAEIEGFVLTGNVLLVVAGGVTAAWLVPPPGFAENPLGRRLADRRDALWTIPDSCPRVGVAGKVGFIETYSGSRIFYHTETGEVRNFDYSTAKFHEGYLMYYFYGNDYLHFHGLPRINDLPGGGWQTSREGWVKDSEGRSRFWLPVDWRGNWRAEDWWDDAMTQFSFIGGKVVVVKF